jgi:hypothetical protein
MPVDALLVQATLLDNDDAYLTDLVGDLQNSVQSQPFQIHAVFSLEKKLFYAYLQFSQRELLDQAAVTALASSLKNRWPQLQTLQVSRLEKVFETEGTSAGSKPVFHYVVEMDPETHWMPALAEWYDIEHMPGLAKVPGCIRATRFLNHDHGPLSLACYDLVTEEALGSAPWLAVRGTEWSSRMRPRFTNTQRTMFNVMTQSKR